MNFPVLVHQVDQSVVIHIGRDEDLLNADLAKDVLPGIPLVGRHRHTRAGCAVHSILRGRFGAECKAVDVAVASFYMDPLHLFGLVVEFEDHFSITHAEHMTRDQEHQHDAVVLEVIGNTQLAEQRLLVIEFFRIQLGNASPRTTGIGRSIRTGGNVHDKD